MDLMTSVKYRHIRALLGLLAPFICLIMVLNACQKSAPVQKVELAPVLTPVTVTVQKPSDIQMVKNGLAPALLYSNISGLDSLPLDEKKMRFISALLPAILVAKYQIDEKRAHFQSLLRSQDWSPSDSSFYLELSVTYRTNDTTALLSALHTHPNSIVLAQAAVESGWGNSRIFGEANNLFGIWSYRSSEPRIAASVKRGDQTIYLRKYNDISESISDYFVTIGRSRPYASFRNTRMTTDSVELLLPHLIYYSERREEYTEQLGSMIRFNELKRFDDYRLDSSYFVVPKEETEE